jgi:protein gp37
MGKETAIQWCDSTLNLQMGCDGCELWNVKAGVKACYAGTLTERYGGRAGYPAAFHKPRLFLSRLDDALRWPDLAGKERPAKPWLSGLPRMIFLDDMGDTFTESLPLDWLAPLLPRMADSPHVYMLLTKRGERMRRFSEEHFLPANVWPGVSVTTHNTCDRIAQLVKVHGSGVRWVSAEPLWGSLALSRWLVDHNTGSLLEDAIKLGLVIIGGQSGSAAKPTRIENVMDVVGQCLAAQVPVFLKQVGSAPMLDYYCRDEELREWALSNRHSVLCPADNRFFKWEKWDGQPPVDAVISFRLKDGHGGDMSEWAERLRVREFPALAATTKPERKSE